MTSHGTAAEDSGLEMAPHHARLIEKFFDPSSKKVILLRSDPGMGKGNALVALAARLLGEEPAARILFLVPALMRSQFQERFLRAGIPAVILDRYRFREMVDSEPPENFWPRGSLMILSLDFAKQTDVLGELSAAAWGLVVVDEAHLVKGARARALSRIAQSAKRVILSTLPGLKLTDISENDETTVVEWERNSVQNEKGDPIYPGQTAILHEEHFRLSQKDLRLLKALTSLNEALLSTSGAQLIGRLFLRTFWSSPGALEHALSLLSLRIENSDQFQLVNSPSEEETEQDDAAIANASMDKSLVSPALRKLEELLEKSGGDSKLNKLCSLVPRLIKEGPNRRVCVLTEFTRTIFYLAAEIENWELPQLLLGEMDQEDRETSLRIFSDGGLLLATNAAFAYGDDLRMVTDLILYDIPSSATALATFLDGFDRFDRPLNVFVLVPENTVDEFFLESWQELKAGLG